MRLPRSPLSDTGRLGLRSISREFRFGLDVFSTGRLIHDNVGRKQYSCGTVETGCPRGLMFVGKRFDEPTIYRAAYAFE